MPERWQLPLCLWKERLERTELYLNNGACMSREITLRVVGSSRKQAASALQEQSRG